MIAVLADQNMGQQAGPGRPRSISNAGISAWAMLPHCRQEKAGRTWRMTWKRPGM
jgi:hypothetical protein